MAAPVTRDNIYFCSNASSDTGFYVEVQDGDARHRHPRAKPSVLLHLLNPDAGTKDEPAHFYTAQLLHHGLKPYKTKTAAKKHLLEAFGGGKDLKVPKSITELKKELQKEFAEAEKKAKSGGSKSKGKGKDTGTAKVEVVKSNKRKADPVEKVEEEDLPVGMKASSSKKKKVAPSDSVEIDSSSSKKGKNTAAKNTITKVTTKVITTKVTTTKGTATKASASKATAGTSKASASKATKTKLKSGDTQGLFDITAPKISEGWSSERYSNKYTLKMSPSVTGRHLWMSFDFGVITGIMRTKGKPPTTVGTSSPFEWRGIEEGEGEMTFTDENIGTITFLGGGKIQGTISGSFLGENVPFSGTAVERPNVVWYKYVAQWKKTWRGINWTAWERASRARWGACFDDEGCEEGPADSDTSAGECALEDGKDAYSYGGEEEPEDYEMMDVGVAF